MSLLLPPPRAHTALSAHPSKQAYYLGTHGALRLDAHPVAAATHAAMVDAEARHEFVDGPGHFVHVGAGECVARAAAMNLH